MHELALSQSIVDLVVEVAERQRAGRVTRVVVQVGVVAGVAPEALRFCFDVAAGGTLADGAELAINTVELRCRCRTCGAEFEPESLLGVCPGCGGQTADILAGRELKVQAVDVEDAAPPRVALDRRGDTTPEPPR